ncbi:Pol polyprotein [Plakobranchus ocellatus]|uniref:Pol polyprotein n=1 Tax=Plakobranchus ocellatus TaxID=259542 RepID=A0AAV3XX00_9GAST|nr:Pol polyprotein [Plakobranchus ocellatus]
MTDLPRTFATRKPIPAAYPNKRLQMDLKKMPSCERARTHPANFAETLLLAWNELYYVFDYCRRCHRCQVTKATVQTAFRTSVHITENHLLEMIAIDFTQMEMLSDGKDTVIVITDVFSKWDIAVPVKDQTAC